MRKEIKLKLLWKLLRRIIALILATSLTIGIFSYFQAASSIQDITFKNVDDQLELRTDLIGSKLDRAISMIDIISSEYTIITDLQSKQKSKATESTFDKIMEENSDLLSLISMVDSNGVILATDDSNKHMIGANISDRDYLEQAKKSKQVVVSEKLISKATGLPVLVVAKPVIENNRYIGAIVATVNYNLLTEVVAEIQIAEHGYGYIVDVVGEGKGNIEWHPNPEMIGKNLSSFENKELDELLEKMITEEKGDGVYTFDKVQKYAAFKRIGSVVLVITADEKDLLNKVEDIFIMTLIILSIGIILSSIICYFIVNVSIIKPIKELEESMDAAGKGDLTRPVDIKTKDEIQHLGECYNEMLSNQHSTIKKIGIVSGDLNASAEELTASSEDVNASAEEVSQNIEEMMNNSLRQKENFAEIVSEIENLNASIESSHQLTVKSQEACNEAVVVTRGGRESLVDSIDSINNISDSTNKIIDTFTSLNEGARKVTGISETIKSIAEQINLLALNASIEAARAGEAGRGFTVVAEEVRKLAEQTTLESSNIHDVLNSISQLIVVADSCVNTTRVHVDTGETSIKSLDGKLGDIINTFNGINEDITSLDVISSEQVQSSDRIGSFAENMSKTVEMNSTMSQEISASSEEQAAITENLTQSSEETSTMAEDLNKLIDRFKL